MLGFLLGRGFAFRIALPGVTHIGKRDLSSSAEKQAPQRERVPVVASSVVGNDHVGHGGLPSRSWAESSFPVSHGKAEHSDARGAVARWTGVQEPRLGHARPARTHGVPRPAS